MGLLLDKNQIPIGMKLYPGNESEKPIMRNVIDELKNSNNIKGRTIHVADKGLNCAQNIAFSKKHGDGYLFSKSVKGLPQKERSLAMSQAKKSQFGESGKYVNFTDKDGKKAVVGINEKAIEKALKFAGYNLLVTSETKMKDEEMYQIYHNLWRIEESFKIMKSDLDARPVFYYVVSRSSPDKTRTASTVYFPLGFIKKCSKTA